MKTLLIQWKDFPKEVNQFYKWYDQYGPITLHISRKFNNNEELELIFSQTCKNYKLPVPIPIKFSFLDEYGKFTKFNYGK